jgi:hypothetical protein
VTAVLTAIGPYLHSSSRPFLWTYACGQHYRKNIVSSAFVSGGTEELAFCIAINTAGQYNCISKCGDLSIASSGDVKAEHGNVGDKGEDNRQEPLRTQAFRRLGLEISVQG